MGLISHALAAGVGYVLGRPDTRQKLIELAQHPKAQQLREQGQNLAAGGIHTAQRRLGRTPDHKATPAGKATSTQPSPAPRTQDPAAADDAARAAAVRDSVADVTDLPPVSPSTPEPHV